MKPTPGRYGFDMSAVNDVALAIFTGLLVFFGWRQANALRESVDEMQKTTAAAQTSADLAARMESPTLGVSGIWVRGFEREWDIFSNHCILFDLRNYGRTPAMPLEIEFGSYSGADLTDASQVVRLSIERRPGYVHQQIKEDGTQRITGGPNAPVADANEIAIKAGAPSFWIILTIQFRDYMNNSHIWRASFKWDTDADNFIGETRPAFNFQRRVEGASGT